MAVLAPPASGYTRCPNCGWKGEAYLFTPAAVQAVAAELALPDDATCIHHPRKKAVAVCAGTGDYICSLCAVELKGQTYSAQYLEAGGKETVGKAFERTLPRPDSQIVLYYVLLILAPYVNAVMAALAFIWIPHAFFLYFKALRMRRTDPLFARVMGMGRVIVLPILLSLTAIGWVVGVVALVSYLLTQRS